MVVVTPVGAESLQQAVQRTLSTNPEVVAKVNQQRAREQALRQARSGFGPAVDLTMALGKEQTENLTTRGVGAVAGKDDDETMTRRESAVTVRQMLFDGFATRSEVQRQTARVEAATHTVGGTAEQIALRTTEVYLEVLRNMELLVVARENLEAHRQTYDQIELRSKSGVGRKADSDQVTGRLAQAMANVISQESNLNDAYTNYLRVTGEQPVDLAYPKVSAHAVPQSLEAAVESALSRHPTLKSAEADVAAARAQHEASRNTYYPRFDVEASGGWNENMDGQRGANNDNSVMVRMRYNMFRSGGDTARIRETAYLVNEAKDIRDNTRRQVIEGIRLSWNQHRSIGEKLEFLSVHVESSKRTLEAYRKQFNIGKRSLLDVLDSENELFEARRSYINARYERTLAYYRVQAGIGNLVNSLGLSDPEPVVTSSN